MTTGTGSARDANGTQEAVISRGQEPQPRESGRHRVIMLGIELDTLARLLRDRRFHENVIIGAIALAALARIARESQARALMRLAAWDNRQRRRHQRKHRARGA